MQSAARPTRATTPCLVPRGGGSTSNLNCQKSQKFWKRGQQANKKQSGLPHDSLRATKQDDVGNQQELPIRRPTVRLHAKLRKHTCEKSNVDASAAEGRNSTSRGSRASGAPSQRANVRAIRRSRNTKRRHGKDWRPQPARSIVRIEESPAQYLISASNFGTDDGDFVVSVCQLHQLTSLRMPGQCCFEPASSLQGR
jgi:hypothetical protein